MSAEPLAQLAGVADLLARSRAIGSDPSLVIHGGGNTSCKTEATDHRGRARTVLVIKASGADLRSLDAGGLVALYLDDLLAVLTQAAMDDEAMTRHLAHSRADLGPRRPSIETLLHAFLPARHIDHVHADAICALTNGPDAPRTVREALGPNVAYLPYERPGFALARAVAEHHGAEAVVLGHHGLVTWGEESAAAYARMRAIVARADEFLAARRGPAREARPTELAGDAAERLLLTLRGALSRPDRRVLALDPGGRVFADRDDVEAIVAAGPATADHLLRTRANPLVIRSAEEVPEALAGARARATAIWCARGDRSTAQRDPRPAVMLVPGLGTVASARDEHESRTIAEVAARSHTVAATVLDAFGRADSLDDGDLHDLEYWPLELAKLGSAAARELESRIVIVTGGASGIGRDTALRLAQLGAHVAVADRDYAQAAETASRIVADGGAAFATRCDVTDAEDVEALFRATVTRWGGLDGVVSNAGVAVTGEIASLSEREWARSLSVNATSHFLVARRALRTFGEQGIGGSVVFVASKNAFSPGASFGAYSVAKAAEVQLARIVAIEGGAAGVRANVVSPDAVFGGSHLWDGGLREARAAAHGVPIERIEEFYAQRSLLGVAVRGTDVAEAVAFCLSDRSSRMTGCVLTVDGGVAAAFPR
ncbi:MAG TPA: SDR family oxidoreductase [Candidatus Acidoferrales bacterium]|nr:SDR family oxidoreductase [Candidatus Acidoferrales bacterium]